VQNEIARQPLSSKAIPPLRIQTPVQRKNYQIMNSKKKIVKMINDLKEETQKLVFDLKENMNKQLNEFTENTNK
jgi:hypothetical protein